ncbi:hypothetical protein D3C76_87530 [compost metagenome]
MSIRHNKLMYLLFIALLAMFMALSLPVISINTGSSESVEREAFVTGQTIRSYQIAVRPSPVHSYKLTGNSTSNLPFLLPVVASLFIAVLRAPFRPLFYLLLKQKLLLSIKFTSKYVV